jgi:hypothetical protein
LLPLWEGFDEPFHFAYVQQLANTRGLADPSRSTLSAEVWCSLLLAPASPVIKQNLPQVTTYAEYFSSPQARRFEVRRQLFEIPTGLQFGPSPVLNYEAHQPPLAYAILAVPERLLADVPLPVRVAALRVAAAISGSLLLLTGADRLLSRLRIPDLYKTIALFCLLSCQMTWATLAHVANDWLAVPISVWTLVAFLTFEARPSRRAVAIAALLLAAGLLTKAYFLAIVPLLAALCVLRRRWHDLAIAFFILGGLAGPWYSRNIVRYGVLTGTQEARGGVNPPAVVVRAPELNWPAVVWSSLRSSLWTGNNSFVTFSAKTIDLMIGACLIALLLWAATRKAAAEWTTFWYCASFVLALGYAAVASHVYTHGAAKGPSPWYAQLLIAPALGLIFAGACRSSKFGAIIAAILALLFGYVLCATYVVKLIPLYGGYDGRTSLTSVAALYSHRLAWLAANLDAVALAPSVIIFLLTGIVMALAISQEIIFIRAFARAPGSAYNHFHHAESDA